LTATGRGETLPDVDTAVTALLLAAALSLLLAGYRLHGAVRRLRARRRQRRAEAGERDAERLLRARGYHVCETQPRRRLTLHVDGEPRTVEVRADYLVRRGGRSLVAEVKTGERAPRPHAPKTRRQLLEYRLVYDVSGVLLVDMERGSILEVEFPWLPTQPTARLRWLLLGCLLGGALALLVLTAR
jgi:hypothetical protein